MNEPEDGNDSKQGAIDWRTSRRDFLRIAGIRGVVFASALRGRALAGPVGRGSAAGAGEEFTFVQLSDTHWDAQGTLEKAVAAVNALDEKPDFVVFTGDLTHTTDDAKVRRERMARFREIASGLRIKDVHYLAGRAGGDHVSESSS